MYQITIFNVGRNKFKLKGKTANILKNELYSASNKCYLCNCEFEKKELQLEHKIPVEVGGHLWKRENINLCCIKCHRKKTELDILTINELKRMKILITTGRSVVSLENLKDFYNYIYELFKLGKERYYGWYNGVNGKDYEEKIDRSNRE